MTYLLLGYQYQHLLNHLFLDFLPLIALMYCREKYKLFHLLNYGCLFLLLDNLDQKLF